MHEMTRLISLMERKENGCIEEEKEADDNDFFDNATTSSMDAAAKTVFQTSAGMGDVILTCTAGRGRLLAADFVKYGQEHGRLSTPEENKERWNTLELELLHGMKLPDWHNAQYVYAALSDWNCQEEFPLLTAVYQIGFEGAEPRDCLVQAVRDSIQKASC
jgi:glycerol-3-phosphate dehydrogenase